MCPGPRFVLALLPLLKMLSYRIPCLIYTTRTSPDQDMLDLAVKYDVPIFITAKATSAFMA